MNDRRPLDCFACQAKLHRHHLPWGDRLKLLALCGAAALLFAWQALLAAGVAAWAAAREEWAAGVEEWERIVKEAHEHPAP